MATSVNYYETLGVARDADSNTIRKAYRALALRWHPDKNPGAALAEAEAKFKDINEAFTVLSDVGKRAAYDRNGPGGNESDSSPDFDFGHMPFHHFARNNSSHHPHGFANFHQQFSRDNAFDVFRAFFNGGDPFASTPMSNDPFASMGFGMGMGSPFGLFGEALFGGGMMGGGIFGNRGGFGGGMLGGGGFGMLNHGSHMRQHTDPFGGMLSLSSSGFGGGFGGGMGVGMSSSSSTTRDSSGRTITETTETTMEGGQTRTTVTTKIRHPDGRVEQTEKRLLNGQPAQAALPAASQPAVRNIHIADRTPYSRETTQPRAPIDLRSPDSDTDEDEVQEIPPPRRSARPTHTHTVSDTTSTRAPPSATTASTQSGAASRPLDFNQPSHAPPGGPSVPQPTATPSQLPWQAASPFPPPASASSFPSHQRASTSAFAAAAHDLSFERERAEIQARQREIEAQVEQARLEQRAQMEMEAQRAAQAARARHEAATAQRYAQHGRYASAAAGYPYSPVPSIGNAPMSSIAGISGRVDSSLYPRSVSSASPYASSNAVTSSSSSTLAASARNVLADPSPLPISSVPRGVSGEMLNSRADSTFDELFKESHTAEEGRRTKL